MQVPRYPRAWMAPPHVDKPRTRERCKVANQKPAGCDGKSILIVDDDSYFRQLIVQILKPFGMNLLEAGSSEEGMNFVDHDIALAIIDFRSPETDGLAFISRLREAGKRMPVVFVSANWMDPSTFNWLRNILKVSLVLLKPIQPQLFVQQLDDLLPGLRQETNLYVEPVGEAATQAEWARVLSQSARFADNPGTLTDLPISDNMNPVDTDENLPIYIDDETPSHSFPALPAQQATQPNSTNHSAKNHSTLPASKKIAPEEELLRQLKQLRNKLEAEAQIKRAQASLRKEFPAQWAKLSHCLQQMQSNPIAGELRQQAIHVAQRLRGTASSLSLQRVGACATKIEEMLRMFGASTDENDKELWREIIRAVQDGEKAIALGETIDCVEHRFGIGNVLSVTREPALKQHLDSLKPFMDIDCIVAETITNALAQANASQLDALIVDAAAAGKEDTFKLVREIRMTAGNQSLPLLLVSPANEIMSPVEMFFLGASAQLNPPLKEEAFEAALRRLGEVCRSKTARILVIDDDTVLTRFIHSVLTAHGYDITVLGEPIRILDALEQVLPDLVLMNVAMPGMSGYDVCRMLHNHPKWHNMPVIFLTTRSDAEGRAAAFQASGNDFLSKPILAEELINRVKIQVQGSKAKRDRANADALSGVLKMEIFERRATEAFADAQAKQKKVSLCLLTIDSLDNMKLDKPFAACAVVSAVGKLLQARFKAEELRGRWNDGFALVVYNEDAQTIDEAMELLANEIAEHSFASAAAEGVELSITWGVSSYPTDGRDYETLFEVAKARHIQEQRMKSGITLS